MTTAAANSTTTGTLPANTLLRVLGASIVTITRNGAVVATQSTERDNFVGPYPTDTSYSVVAGGAAVDISVKDGGGVSEALVPAKLSTDANNNTVLVDAVGNVIIRPVVSYTWADRPAAATNIGLTIRVTDVGGLAGSLWISDGVYWRPVSGVVVLGGSGVAISCPENTTLNTLATVIVPALSMGTNGVLRVSTSWSVTNSANSKTIQTLFAGAAILSSGITTSASNHSIVELQNRGATNAQVGGAASGSGSYGSAGGALPAFAIDTSADAALTLTGQKALASEVLKLERYLVELLVP